jgi:hypothetical protein
VWAAALGGIEVQLDGPTSTGGEELGIDPLLLGAAVAIGTLVVALVSFWAIHRHQARQQAMPGVAAGAGLQYAPDDPFGCTRVAFPLFRAGDGREVTNVMWRAEGTARVFDYRYYKERVDQEGRRTQTWYPSSCATARHNGSWPDLRILRERIVDRALVTVGLPDIQLESEEFNRSFIVQCRDAKFATDLLDPQMMELLLSAKGKVDVTLMGRFVLLTAKQLAPAELPWLLGLAEGFVERVPPVVRDLYASHPADAEPAVDPLGYSDLLRGADLGAGLVGGAFVDWRDDAEPTEPKVEYDLDGNPLPPPAESPWDDRLD